MIIKLPYMLGTALSICEIMLNKIEFLSLNLMSRRGDGQASKNFNKL